MIDLLWRNLGWKLFALLIAVMLWIAVANEPELSTFVSVPVEFKDLPKTLEIGSDVAEKVDLEMRGPSGELQSFSANRAAVVFDMSDAAPGERTYLIGEENLHLPRGLRLIRAIPPGVRFVFERRKTRVVPVEVRFTEPKPAKFRVTPASLAIEGPESHVNRLSTLVTDQIDVSALNGSGTFHTTALAGDKFVRIDSDPEVTVEVWK
jgi:YbbR domain-containing protein